MHELAQRIARLEKLVEALVERLVHRAPEAPCTSVSGASRSHPIHDPLAQTIRDLNPK